MSLSTKLFLIFIGAFVLLGALAWGFSKPWRGPWRDQMPKVLWVNLRAHLVEVSEKIGSPPSEEKARSILSDLQLEIMVRENDQILFSTVTDAPPWSDLSKEIEREVEFRSTRPASLRAKLGDFIVGRTDGRVFAELTKDNRRFIYFLPEPETFQVGLRAFGGFAFGIAFLLVLVLVITNWLLRPMKPLMEGVSALSQGNLDYRVSIQPRGEFRRVAEAFNGMAETLQRQLKSKDQLLMDVSHELRSPMGRIKMAAEMLPLETSTEMKSQIQADIREMEDLVTELLELYRMRDSKAPGFDSRHFEEINLGSLIREVIAPVLQAQEKPGIEYRLPPPPILMKGDARQMKRAIRNVIENAVKFSREQERPVEVSLETRDGFHVLEICDFGIGMTAEQVVRVFEPFYRADSSRVRATGGFGLGLPLASAIVKAHGGSIECESILGQGSLFRIRLPA